MTVGQTQKTEKQFRAILHQEFDRVNMSFVKAGLPVEMYYDDLTFQICDYLSTGSPKEKLTRTLRVLANMVDAGVFDIVLRPTEVIDSDSSRA